MFTSDGYALLIGVDDYSAFDRSTAQNLGTSDLGGSRNDVRAFWTLCRLMGLSPANVRVLASPPIRAGELAGAIADNVRPATKAEMDAGVAWLAEKLGQVSRPTGLLTYSGHGDWLADEGLVLCPSDVVDGGTTGADARLKQAVSFKAINAVFDRHDAAENLTVVLDTSHSGGVHGVKRSHSEHTTGRPLSLTLRSLSDIKSGLYTHPSAAPVERLRGRVLTAAAYDGVAYQSIFDGKLRGVFSWAITNSLGQWKLAQEGDNVRSTVCYDRLLETARRLVGGLWFTQVPELHGPSGIAALAVFQKGLVMRGDASKERPNGGVKMHEITPSYDQMIISFNDTADTAFATVYVFNSALGEYEANTEYWFVNLDSLSMLGEYSLSVATTFQTWTGPPAAPGYSNMQSFSVANSTSWSTPWTTDPVSGGTLHSGPRGVWLRLQLSTSPAGLASITWYQVLASGDTPANLAPNGTFTVEGASVKVRTGNYGYDISQQS